ncbi:MAG: hypothetical protein ACE5HB_10340 [Terriglobia bacterium]
MGRSKKVRRSRRQPAAIPIRVFGTTLKGRDFSEDCVCTKVSRYGAQVRMQHLLVPDDIVRILHLKTKKEAEFRVVAQIDDPPDKPYADWGVESVDSEANIWRA